jgi:hypothetical protein
MARDFLASFMGILPQYNGMAMNTESIMLQLTMRYEDGFMTGRCIWLGQGVPNIAISVLPDWNCGIGE